MGGGFVAGGVRTGMILLREKQGDTLQGDIDEVNTVYTTTYNFDPDTVNIYVNGRLKIKDWDDGFWATAPDIVTMKEPLKLGDSLEVEYKSDVKTGGGADGGCPEPPQVYRNVPGVSAEQDLPGVAAGVLEPQTLSSGENSPTMTSDELVPVIIAPKEGC